MFDRLTRGLHEVEAALAELEPAALVGGQPAAGLELLGHHERIVAAARLKLTDRAAEMNHWQRLGFRSFEDWLAARDGTSAGTARRRTRTARRLRDRDKTADALADGEISEDEADVIADAAEQNPDAEDDLLSTAKNEGRSHDDLRKRAADAKAAGEDDRQRAERHRRGRRVGWGLDRDGFWTLSGRFQPDVGAELKAALIAETDRVFARARRAGRREPVDRFRADALAALISGDHRDTNGNEGSSHDSATVRGAGADEGHDPLGLDLSGADTTAHASAGPPPTGPVSRAGREIIVDIDLAALRRGCVEPGETCTIRGVGPVPVEVARAWVDDAFLKAVIRDGTDVRKVAHFGRHIPAPLRTALGVIDRHSCEVPACDNPRAEYDHDVRFADGGPCSTANLRSLCVHHHRQRTHDGYELEGEPGDRRWVDPEGNVLFADRPPHLATDRQRAP